MRFLISGYYGYGNLGDEALLQIIVERLRERYPRAAIEVLSADPERTQHELRVEASPRAEPANLRRAIAQSDIVLSGGGGLLQNTTSLRSLLYYAGIIRSAIKAGRKTMIFAQSIGPLDFIGRQTVRECCRGLHAATVRDERSRAMLAPLVPRLKVERTADVVFLERGTGDGHRLAGVTDGEAPLVIVSVRSTAKFTEVSERIAKAIDRAAQAYGARVALVPFSSPADAEVSTLIVRRCKSKPMLLPVSGLRDVTALLPYARLVIGVRLHSLILATRYAVPFLAVPYDPKVLGLCEDIGYPLAPLWSASGDAGDPAALVDEAWERHDELRALLQRAAREMEALALRNFEVLDRLAG